MSVKELDVVDVISTDKETGHVILTISDHLDWSDSIQHQTALQAKFNKYLAFVESGEILESEYYPWGGELQFVNRLLHFILILGETNLGASPLLQATEPCARAVGAIAQAKIANKTLAQ